MPFAIIAKRTIRERKFSLNFSKGFIQAKVMMLNKFYKIFSICKVNHWNTSKVNDISIVEYNDYVYNLAVDEDESYTVNGVAVHNCRSQIVAALLPKYQQRGI